MVIHHAWSSDGHELRFPTPSSEPEHPQSVSLSAYTAQPGMLKGTFDLPLKTGTKENTLQRIEGELILDLPYAPVNFEWTSTDIHREQTVGTVKVQLISMNSGEAKLQYEGPLENRIKLLGLNKSGQVLVDAGTGYSGSSVSSVALLTYRFYGNLDRARFYIGQKTMQRRYPFILNRVRST
jgi:hypothetical protein